MILFFCSVLTAIFISTFFLYYYFIICIVFVPLGVISIMLVTKSLVKKNSTAFVLVYSCLILIFSLYSIKSKDFFGYSIGDLKSRNFDLGSIEVFSDIIERSSDKSLICFGMEYNIGVFTKAKIVPTHKYFFSPNFYPDKYPIIYDSLSGYINKHSVKYLALSDDFIFISSFYDQIIDNSYKPISKIGIYTLYEYSE